MTTFLTLFLLLAVLLSIDAAPFNQTKPSKSDIAKLRESDVANYYFKDCVSGTTKTIELDNGAIEYSCEKVHKKDGISTFSSGHTFGTNLFVWTNSGSVGVSVGGNGASIGGTVYQYRYGGYVDSAWGTSRAVVYPWANSMDEVDKFGKLWTGDQVFWFDSYNWVCQFGFSNEVIERSCPLLMVIKFTT
ncbi:hypothetical protein BGZ76_011825 [Entomortierella beljakovae]|nr:hypothetical protein BGZ76_011825 [Entomortierella beljakovae]